MKLENRRGMVKLISLIVSLCGVMVMIGWIFDIDFLKGLPASWISMKFDTAVAFLLSGISLYFIVRTQEGEFDKAQVVISITSLIIMLLMGILFFSSIFRIQTGAEHLIFNEVPGGVKTVIPGRPSIPTMFSFILVAIAGVLSILHLKNIRTTLVIIGLFVGIIGASAVLGYIINAPYLYYYFEGVNSAMAFLTATLFALLGAGLICLYE
ncbi:MAG: hypothetical protein WAX69_22510 [Victivallales bacterium]